MYSHRVPSIQTETLMGASGSMTNRDIVVIGVRHARQPHETDPVRAADGPASRRVCGLPIPAGRYWHPVDRCERGRLPVVQAESAMVINNGRIYLPRPIIICCC